MVRESVKSATYGRRQSPDGLVERYTVKCTGPSAPVAQDKLLELVERRSLVVDFRLQEELAPVRRLMAKYRDAPMSLADACLVRMAETMSLSICTLDSHFSVYRQHGRTSLTVISPG